MAEDGETKDDVKVPEGEVGDKIEKLFTTEEKDTSMSAYILEAFLEGSMKLTSSQMLSFLLLWVSNLPLKPRKLLAVLRFSSCQNCGIDLVVINGWHTLSVCRWIWLGVYSS